MERSIPFKCPIKNQGLKQSASFVQAAAIAVPIVAPSDGAEQLEHESRRLGQNGRVLELSVLFTLCLELIGLESNKYVIDETV